MNVTTPFVSPPKDSTVFVSASTETTEASYLRSTSMAKFVLLLEAIPATLRDSRIRRDGGRK